MAGQQDPLARRRSPEELASQASAQAALMLVESLALVLVENGVVSSDAVVEAFENVMETKRRLGEESEDAAVAARAAGLVSIIANSLRLAHGKLSG